MAVLLRGPDLVLPIPRSQNRENHSEGPLHIIAGNSADDIPRDNVSLLSASLSFGTLAEFGYPFM